MAQPSSSPLTPKGRFQALRRIPTILGFQKRYNFIIFSTLSLALLGFTLARLPYISFTYLCGPSPAALPGSCHTYTTSPSRTGITLHLATILPACLLAILQFTPFLRRKFTLFHRVNGYVVAALVLAGEAGAGMLARRSFGGDVAVVGAVGVMVVGVTGGMGGAVWSIKTLRIERHRAWMLRVWAWLGSVVTMRLVAIITATLVSADGGYFAARPCAQIGSMISQEDLVARYPACENAPGGTQVVVHASMTSGRVEEISVALGMAFGLAMWLGLGIHAVLVEVYLHCTPAESERLRQVSLARRMEAGMRNEGGTPTVGRIHCADVDAAEVIVPSTQPKT